MANKAEKKDPLELEKAQLDAEAKSSGLSVKLTCISGKIFSFIKLALGVCFLPFVYSISASFLNEFSLIDKPYQDYFWQGILTFLVIFLFVWEPAIIYAKGQKILEVIFKFFTPLVKVAPYVLPIYTIILFIFYKLFSIGIHSRWLVDYTVSLLGLSVAFHLVFSAKSIRSKKGDFLKANYIFGFSFIYITNILLLAFCFNLIFEKYSFVNFFNNSFGLGKNIFWSIFKQLFLR